MQLEWDSSPSPHQSRTDRLERNNPPVSYPAALPTTSSLSGPAQRRRSSAAHIRPAGPPPNLPIPSVPSASPTSLTPSSSLDSQDFNAQSGPQQVNGRGTRSTSFNRPGASANLTAVANFSQIRQTSSAPASQSPLQAVGQPDDLSDPPPPSVLPLSSSHGSERSHDNGHSRHLSPPNTEHRPSSRRALTRALELAREAVQLDSTNEDPEAAVNAYAQSVALLSEVMERVRRGEDSTESRRSRRRRSVAAQEEEVRRLQNIHDTYADRMNILSIIYSIPPVPYAASPVYPPGTRAVPSPQSNSPTTSRLPSSENSPQIPQVPYKLIHLREEAQYNAIDYARRELDDTSHPIGSPITLDESVLIPNAIPGLPPTSYQHPYAASYNIPQPPEPAIPAPATRTSALKIRPRTPSQLPPAQPPPSNNLPPAPTPAFADTPLDSTHPQVPSRTELAARTHSDYAARSLPGPGLTPLEEEANDGRVELKHRGGNDDTEGIALDTPRNLTKRDEHPLPPTPSPTASSNSPGTPRTSLHMARPPPSPRLTTAPSRPRGAPQVSPRSEPLTTTGSQPVPIINPTIAQSTIHQRRTKASVSVTPASRPASPVDSALLAGQIQKQPQPQPVTATPNMHPGRSRSSSQPGHRPSIISGQAEQRPPLPLSTGLNPLAIRKPSFPSKLLSVELMSPQVGTPTPSFLAVSSMSSGVPFAPASSLPPAPPTDPLRQPYHMMNLLAASMTSPSGGYITRRLHVPNEVWSFPGVKPSNLAEKIRVLEILSGALEDVQLTSSDYFGAGNVSSGLAMGIGSIGRTEANAWLAKLEEFSNICDGVVANFGKKLGVGEGFVLKKTTWDKLSRRFDKFTSGKNVDSPMAYMHNLKKLFLHVQLLDEHTKAVSSQPIAPAYAAFPPDVRASAEQKLKRASEFFASVVLTFVIRDLALLLDKYVKKCEKILED